MAGVSAVVDALVVPVLALGALGYLALAVYISRRSPQSFVGFFLFLIGMLVTGSVLSLSQSDLNVFGIGRVIAYFSAGFMPVVFYAIYRQYIEAPPSRWLLLVLSIIPTVTTLLALTNPLHYLIWEPHYTEAGLTILQRTDKAWFTRAHAPFAYGLFGFTVIAMASRLPSIAPAHRRTVAILVFCAVVPFAASIVNTFLGVGDADAPVLAFTLSALLPVFAYVSLRLRVHDFNPVAYQTLFDHVRDPIIVLDKDDRIICANRHAAELLCRSERQLLGHKLWEEIPEARELFKKAVEMDRTQTLMLKNSHAYEISVAPLIDSMGNSQGTVVVCRDVTERRRAQAKLANSEHLVRTLIETSSNGILRFGRNGEDGDNRFQCILANPAAGAFLDRPADSLVGTPLDELRQIDPARLQEHFVKETPAGHLSYEVEYDADAGNRWLRVVAEPIGDDFSVTVIDITERKRDQDRMLEDAVRDPLTGVFNRRGFEQIAAQCIRKEERAAVLYLDLNHFKRVNDEFGHPAGDALLKAFSNRLQHCLRPEDLLGRLGGDEFAIVLPGVTRGEAMRIADRFVAAASESYIIQGTEIECTASVGIALMPHHGEDLWHLVSVADQAMYTAKAAARGESAEGAVQVEVAIAS